MKTIPLTQGKVALVDDEDFEFLSQWKWFANLCRDRWYAIRNETLPNGKQRKVAMHKVLCPGKEIDHEDGNSLNNQKENLRSASHSLNMFNSKRSLGKSGVRGVCLSHSGRWEAKISCGGEAYYLGLYDDLEEAKQARRRAELKFFGEYYEPK